MRKHRSRISGRSLAAVLASAFAASLAYGGATALARTTITGPYIGSYSASLTLDDAFKQGDGRMAGKFTLVLRRNGTYSASNPLDGQTRGRFAALAGHRLRFYDTNGCITGGYERPKGGTYRWSLDGRRLTFRVASEGLCYGRTQQLTYPVWLRT